MHTSQHYGCNLFNIHQTIRVGRLCRVKCCPAPLFAKTAHNPDRNSPQAMQPGSLATSYGNVQLLSHNKHTMYLNHPPPYEYSSRDRCNKPYHQLLCTCNRCLTLPSTVLYCNFHNPPCLGVTCTICCLYHHYVMPSMVVSYPRDTLC